MRENYTVNFLGYYFINFKRIKIIDIPHKVYVADFLVEKKVIEVLDVLTFCDDDIFEREVCEMRLLPDQVVDYLDDLLKGINYLGVFPLWTVLYNTLLQGMAIMFVDDFNCGFFLWDRMGKFYLVDIDEVRMG